METTNQSLHDFLEIKKKGEGEQEMHIAKKTLSEAW